MSPSSVSGFISGPWLDWIAEPYREERAALDVETLARAFVKVGMVIDGMTAAEAREMVAALAAEYQRLAQ
jgi:hypothetical protein